MLTATPLPNLTALVEPLLGAPYEQWHCYNLVRHLLHAGFGVDLEEDPHHAAKAIVEVWYQGDSRDPLSLVRPWDCYILACKGLVSDHLGLVVDTQYFVHTRPRTGVCLERMARWQQKLLQLARLRMLA